MNKAQDIPVVILAGGKGIFIDDSGKRMAKGNVLINGHPLFFFVIKSYVKYGYRKFLISGSYQLSDSISLLKNKLGFKSESDDVLLGEINSQKISVRFVDSGTESLTAERIKSCYPHLKDSNIFAVTYSDTISNINLSDALEAHQSHGKVASLTAARLPTRFRILGIRPGENVVRGFGQAFLHGHYINGGFYFFNKDIWSKNFLENSKSKVLETDILDALVESENLVAFPHEGLWQHLDSERNLERLNHISAQI